MQNNLFAHRLRESMKEKNMKQIDIMREAEKRGIKLGKSHISQYVSGKTLPRDNILKVLAEILDVDAGWLKGTKDTSVKDKKNEYESVRGSETERTNKENKKRCFWQLVFSIYYLFTF